MCLPVVNDWTMDNTSKSILHRYLMTSADEGNEMHKELIAKSSNPLIVDQFATM